MEDRKFGYNEEFGLPWSIPSELTFSSARASNSRLGCHIYGSYEYCQLIAQYEELIVVFSIRRMAIHDGGIELLNYEEFDAILKSMDDLIASQIAGTQ
jgi:hypothetical protein